jgi:hypothetical protein
MARDLSWQIIETQRPPEAGVIVAHSPSATVPAAF